jgi:alpha-L-rhamnosidase
MKKFFFVLALSPFFVLESNAQLSVQGLLAENRTNPVGLEAAQPRFSWVLTSNERNTSQTGYEVQVNLDKKAVWNSGKILSDSSVGIFYKGMPLLSGKKYDWKVRVWDNHGHTSPWSAVAIFQTGLLHPDEWKAKWIQPGFTEEASRPSPLFRKSFSVDKPVHSATVYITAHGMYEAHINGQRIGDAYLTPGWTSYSKRLQYQVYDVTDILKSGKNAIGAMLGNGWYRGIIGFDNNVNVYGKDIALLMQLIIEYKDGSTQIVGTDESWKSGTGSVRYAEIYNGETIDARQDKPGWSQPDYDDSQWSGVRTGNFSLSNLVATVNEPVRKHETFKPVRILTTPKGEKVLDFGQNLVGWVVLKVKGKPGDSITVSHAEVLDKKGNFYTANLRAAKAKDTYILKDTSEETFEPHFTWHGFQYIRLEGYPGEIRPENFTAVALYSDMQPTGNFSCSSPLVNQLQHNIQWGQKGNFLDVPTDCPQRDERLGWTGDAQVFSRTASFNMNVNSFFAKWLRDLAADQQNGTVPFVIPNVLGNAISSAGWADVATIIPWNMYLAYGDQELLRTQYPSMKAYVESIRKNAKNDLWNTGFHFGDWLFYRPEDDNDGRAAVTDKYLIAQCFYAHSTQLLLNAARVLHQNADADDYASLLQGIKATFAHEYLTPSGRLVSGTQTAYVLALQFDMLPDSLREQAARRLAENIKSYGNHLTTGFLGTPYLCHVLTRYGYNDLAYSLLLQETYPSWLYPVKMGATTIWERWDGIKQDSSFETPSMNSYNHYSYGAIGDWMYRKMVGIDTYEDGPGYKHIRIQPHPGDKIDHASARLETYYGTVSNAWKRENGTLKMDLEIPVNTKATVYLPAGSPDLITEGGKPVTQVPGIKTGGTENGWVFLDLGSGQYHFRIQERPGTVAGSKGKELLDLTIFIK